MARTHLASWDELLTGEPEQAALQLRTTFDELEPAERVALLHHARSEHLERLFEVCRDQPLTFDDLVPGELPGEVWHDGINSLFAFRVFQKRFFQSAEGAVAGYNPGPFNWAITPGYFVVRQEGAHLFFDYTELPRDVPPGWPKPIPNRAKLGRFVYHGLRDDMRQVSRHVCIGAVARHGKPIGTWFALCRRVTPSERAPGPSAPPRPA